MQFLVYSITRETDAPADPKMMEAMGEFMGKMMQTGKLVATGGLATSGKQLHRADGKFTVTDGPFVEAKELTGGFAIISADSEEEIIEWCKQFRDITGDGASEIVRIYGPSDFA